MSNNNSKPRLGQPPKYPWEVWFKIGSVHTLRKGVDYQCTTRSMISYLYGVASRKGRKLSVRQEEEDSIVLVVGRKKSA